MCETFFNINLMNHKGKKPMETQGNHKTKDKMAVVSPHISIITLNGSGWNLPVKRYRLAQWIKNDTTTHCLQKIHLKDRHGNSEKVRGIVLFDIELLQGYISKQHSVDRKTDQSNKIESPEVNPHICRQLLFKKGAKTTQVEKKISSMNGVGKLESHIEKNETRLLS